MARLVSALPLTLALGCAHPSPDLPPGMHRLPYAAGIPVAEADLRRALGDQVIDACPPQTACTWEPTPGFTLWLREDRSAFIVTDRDAMKLTPEQMRWRVQTGQPTPVVYADFPWPGAPNPAAP